MLSKLARSVLTLLKFRRITFKSVGPGCSYKSLSSNYSYAQNIELGENVHIGPGCSMDGAGGIRIGNGVIFAPACTVMSRSHRFDGEITALPFDNVVLTAPVSIGDYVWVGQGVIILPGITVGDGAIIGAGAVVSRDVPPCAVVVGNPAKVVRYRDSDRFAQLRNEEEVFVYKRHGHAKILKARDSA